MHPRPRFTTRLIALASLAAPLLLWADSPAPANPPPEPTAQQAATNLQREWETLGTAAKPAGTAPLAAPAVPEAKLPRPQQRSLAMDTTNSFQEPEEIHSVDHKLTMTLVAIKAFNRIGNDPVYLRSYNGKLTGPTLRAKPGDTLYITLKNDLPPEKPGDQTGHNTLHDFNVTNLHTHGLHVSPSGNSDNVLLTINPGETQKYEIKIPLDHPAGTFWYHAHHHGSTAAQVASGMSGALIIEGGLDTVPEIARARDRVMVLQQIAYIYKNCFPDEDDPTKQTCFDLPYGVIEQKYEDWIFGPNSWDALGRYTTINGVQLPVIRMRPGSVERWRCIDSGMRERIELKLESATAPNGQSPTIVPLHVIAEDGLALGKVDTRDSVELWPGYRADILVQAPSQRGEYLLIDEETAAKESLDGKEEARKYIARVIVEGEPRPMALPADRELAQYRLPSIPASAVDGHQTAVYGILRKPGGGVLFTINGKAFDESNVRELRLGGTDEWTLSSINEVGAVSHPFHIHVNPFEVVSEIDDQGVEQLKEPIWRDTLILHEKWTVKIRTHYSEFTGKFVQHCHILDHEDQGMMEYVEIVDPKHPKPKPPATPYSAADWKLPDANGRTWSLGDFRGKPLVLFFFKGGTCLHCTEQVALFAEQAKTFAAKGIQLVGVTTDSPEVLRSWLAQGSSPFPIVCDPQRAVFRRYRCGDDDLLHGTFVIDRGGLVRWQTVGSGPYIELGRLLREAGQFGDGGGLDLAAATAAVPVAPPTTGL